MARVKLFATIGSLFALILLYLTLQEHEAVPRIPKISRPLRWTYDPERDERNLGLTEEQCEVRIS